MQNPIDKDRETHSQDAAAPQPPARKPAKRRAVRLLLNLIILGLVATGAYMLAEPYVRHWQQDRKTAELLQAIESGDGTIVINSDDLVVPGEEVEFVEAVEDWGLDEPTGDEPEPGFTEPGTPATEPGAPGSTTGTSVSGSGGVQPVGTKAPTPTPKPVVIQAIGQLFIDKIGLKMPIADRAESPQLRVAVGLLGGSSMPGKPGNSIILGHRMYTYGRHFNRLDEVGPGTSVVILTKGGRRLTYTVDRQETILPADMRRVLSQSTSEKQLVLVTCTPVRVASHRLLVYCRQVSDEAA